VWYPLKVAFKPNRAFITIETIVLKKIMVRFEIIMARSILMAGILAGFRRGSGLRSFAAAFSPTSFASKETVLRDRKTSNFMTTTNPESGPGIIPRIKACDAASPSDGPVIVKGWVRTVRKQKTLAFVEVNDGSNLGGIQCVLPFDQIDDETKEEINKLTTGCSVHVTGPLVKSQGGKQAVELSATSLRVIGDCPADTYPLAKKRHSLEYLRTLAHLRPRTNTVAAVARVRSTLAGAIHSFFQSSGFVYLQTPLITASDCEGAGEMFRVTTLDLDNLDQISKAEDEEGKKIGWCGLYQRLFW